MTRVMLDVVSRLNTLPPLPPDADEPQVFGGDNFQTENAASLLVRPIPGHSVPDIAVEYQQLIEEVVEPRLARVPGVSRVNLEGGRPREVQVTLRPAPARCARHLARSAWPRPSSRPVTSRPDSPTSGAGNSPCASRVASRSADLGDLVVGWSDDRPLYLRDVADIRTEHVEARWFSYRSGVPAYYITAQRTSDSNTVEVVDGVKAAIAELNAGPLAREKLYARPVLGRQRLRAPCDRFRRGKPRHRHPARGRRALVLPARSACAAGDRRVDSDLAVLRRDHDAPARAHAERRLARGPRVLDRHRHRRRADRAGQRAAVHAAGPGRLVGATIDRRRAR